MRNPSEVNVLVGCEESQTVCSAFRERGFNAYSCDIQPCSGNHPQFHFNCDIFDVINNKGGITQNGDTVCVDKWDLMIAHPPCTHIAVSGARHFEAKIKDGRQQEAIGFFMKIASVNIPHIAIENPVCIMSSIWRKADQVIQPYYFGDEAQKKTCLWLKNLPLLQHSKETSLFEKQTHVGKGEMVTFKSGKRMSKWMANSFGDGKARSVTFMGIALAMADQWGNYILTH